MSKKTRYYVVKAKVNGIDTTFLVDAVSGPAAEKHVSKKFVGDATIASPKEIADIMGSGVKPEAAPLE